MTWILWATLAGGVVLHVWYAVAWMALPHHHGDFKSAGRGSALETALKAAALPPGMYMFPHYKDYAGWKDPEFEKRLKEPPHAWLVSQPGCGMGGGQFVQALLLNLVEALFLAVLAHLAWSSFNGVFCLLGFSAAVGFLARGAAFASMSVWMSLPWRYTLTTVFDGVVGYALMGVVIHFVHG